MKIDKYADFKINENNGTSRTSVEEQDIVKTALGLKDIWEDDWHIYTIPSKFLVKDDGIICFNIVINTDTIISTSNVIIKSIQYKNNFLFISGETK